MPFKKISSLLSADVILQVLTESIHEIYIFDAQHLRFFLSIKAPVKISVIPWKNCMP
ncbi:MAG: hypothetical protein ABWK15_05320 [Dissulfuribacterales bacterium]